MPGTRSNPISREAYVEKFRANIGGAMSETAGEALIEALLNLEEAEDIGALFAALRR